MDRIKTLLFSITLVFTCVEVASANTTVTGEIKRIYPNGNRVSFRLKDDSCLSPGHYYYFTMDESSQDGLYAAKNWYSMLLASAVSSLPVKVRVNDCVQDTDLKIHYIYQDY